MFYQTIVSLESIVHMLFRDLTEILILVSDDKSLIW